MEILPRDMSEWRLLIKARAKPYTEELNMEANVRTQNISVPVSSEILKKDYALAKKGVAKLSWGAEEIATNDELAKQVIKVCIKTNPQLKEILKGEY